jgi:hypothetical protein
MFGNPVWFREKEVGWGLVPVTWQGWLYAAAWLAVVACPFVLLVERQQAIEALIWMAASSSTLAWDVRGILQSKRRSDDVLYIGEDGLDQAATRRFSFHWRK